MVKALRAATSAGYSDCQKALKETVQDGDKFDEQAAMKWLRAKGLAALGKRAGKTAAEGSVAVAASADQRTAVIVEVNSETDFVSRGPKFLALVEGCARAALETAATVKVAPGSTTLEPASVLAQHLNLTTEVPEGSEVASLPATEKLNISDHISAIAAAVGEKLELRRVRTLSVAPGKQGAVGLHCHSVKATYGSGVQAGGRGTALVLTADEGTQFPVADMADLAKQLATQVTGFGADYINAEDVPQTALDEHFAAYEKAREEKMLARSAAEEAESKIPWTPKKAHSDLVLMEQDFMGTKKKVRDVMGAWCRARGWKPADEKPTGPPVLPIKVTAFDRVVCGEGIQKKEDNFADEVASMLKQ